MKNIAVLGSTGSIGTQTLDVVRANPERLCVKALAAGHNITQLESQIREFHPQIAAVWDEEKAKELRICTADLPVKIVSGMEGLLEIAQRPAIFHRSVHLSADCLAPGQALSVERERLFFSGLF